MRLLYVVALTVTAMALLALVHLVLVRAARRLSLLGRLVPHTHRPPQFVVANGTFPAGLGIFDPPGMWREPVARVLGLMRIRASAWPVPAGPSLPPDLS